MKASSTARDCALVRYITTQSPGLTPSLLESAQYLINHELRLALLVVLLDQINRRPFSVGRPELLLLALLVGGDNVRGRLQDILSRAVVLLQDYDPGVRVILFEAEDITYIGETPRIDGLVGVATTQTLRCFPASMRMSLYCVILVS